MSYSASTAPHVVRAEFAAELDAAPSEATTVSATCEPFLSSPIRVSCQAGCTSVRHTHTVRVPQTCPACGVWSDSVMHAMHHWHSTATTKAVATELLAACGGHGEETLVLGSVVLLGRNAHVTIVRCVLRQVGIGPELLYWTDHGAADKHGWWRRRPDNVLEPTDRGVEAWREVCSGASGAAPWTAAPWTAAPSTALASGKETKKRKRLGAAAGDRGSRGRQDVAPPWFRSVASPESPLGTNLRKGLRFVDAFAQRERERVSTHTWQNERLRRFLEQRPRASWEDEVAARRREWADAAEARRRACDAAVEAARTIRAFLRDASEWD